ncbi:MAG: DegT/DnrJ/EryC1/StrS family aminotransferase [Tannerellaceae bacterium]|jgi:dTDP-4-amino-4,6-dideoxygalactose transaminase|nr:DegT/DnrJ/EryC1/StrS family aminotransferase [Tannerellaceae bacterium]
MYCRDIKMVDLAGQHRRIKDELSHAIGAVMDSGSFINGAEVERFGTHLASYLNVSHVVPCANGTDALQIALMRSGLQRGDEVIVPAFTYAAAVEAAILLGLTPVAADVDERTFNLSPSSVEEAISGRTKAIIAVHLFGQCCDMCGLTDIARRHNLFVIEDNAQSLGSACTFPGGETRLAGAIGHVGTLSFFPTKILGCCGDGGALVTNDEALAKDLQMTTVHGQDFKYHHKITGCNSRLDTIQAAILDIKLGHIGDFISARRAVAAAYNEALGEIDALSLPLCQSPATHVYHQYTVLVNDGRRDALRKYLAGNGVPSAVYYPFALDDQPAFAPYLRPAGSLSAAHSLTKNAVSLPIHTEMTPLEVEYISECVAAFFR